MLAVQFILLAIVVAVFTMFIRQVHTVRVRAFKRIAFVVFVVVTVDAILRPRDTTWVANRLGIGRGADLLLYFLAMAFLFFAVNTYLRFRNLEIRFAELARAMALRDAEPPGDRPAVAPAAAEASAPAKAAAPAAAPTAVSAAAKSENADLVAARAAGPGHTG